MLKKSLSWALFLPCISVYAGTMGVTCESKGVTVPCRTSAWEIGASALYLQPSSIFLNPVIAEGTADPLPSRRFINKEYNWGFNVEGSYYFNKGNFLTVDWLNFSDSNTVLYSQTVANDHQYMFSTNVNIVNAVIGQKIQLSDDANVRLFAGGQYASIKNSSELDILTSPSSGTPSQSSYHGGGPRLGADFSQELPRGFNAFAQGAMSLLVGSGKGKMLIGTGQSVFNHAMQTVPSLDAKLGLGYQVNMQQGSLNVMGGWMFQRYFDAVLINDYKSTYSYSLNGPYIRARWTSFA